MINKMSEKQKVSGCASFSVYFIQTREKGKQEKKRSKAKIQTWTIFEKYVFQIIAEMLCGFDKLIKCAIA